MYFDLSQLLTSHYFLDKTPGGDFLIGYALLILFIVAIFFKSILRYLGPKNKYFRKSIRKGFGKFIALGVTGLIFTSARFSEVPVFSMRLLLYIVFIPTVVLGILKLVKIYKEYKKRIHSADREKWGKE
jgi:hypothetical protein